MKRLIAASVVMGAFCPSMEATEVLHKVHIRAMNGQYLVAIDGGGGDVRADRDVARTWETFSLIDANGGGLVSGDLVYLRTFDGQHWVVAQLGGGSTLMANQADRDHTTAFRVFTWKGLGTRIVSGDQIFLQTNTRGYYLAAERGGGDTVNANRTNVGPWERFTIELDFTTPYDGIRPVSGERPLLVVLAGHPLHVSDTSLYAMKSDGRVYEQIVPVADGQPRVRLITSRGYFVVAEGGGGGDVNANRTLGRSWESFALDDLDGGQLENGDSVRFRSWKGHSLSAVGGGGGDVLANTTNKERWETFVIETVDGTGVVDFGTRFALRTYAGRYVSAEGGGGGALNAKSNGIGGHEIFSFQPGETKPADKFWLQTRSGNYVAAEGGGGGEVTAHRSPARKWETFSLVDRNGGALMHGDTVSLLAYDGKHYLRAAYGGGGDVLADRTTAAEHETFVVVNPAGSGQVPMGAEIALATWDGNFVTTSGCSPGRLCAVATSLGPDSMLRLLPARAVQEELALPPGPKLQSKPFAVDAPSYGFRMVFALGEDGFIYQSLRSATESMWRSWEKLPGEMRFQSGPVAVNSPDGRELHVFATDTKGYIRQATYSRDASSWGPWRSVFSRMTFQDAPAVVVSPDRSHMALFATDTSGLVQSVKYVFADGRWGSWFPLDRYAKFRTGPSVVQTLDGQLTVVFVTAWNGTVYSKVYRWRTNTWQPWRLTPIGRGFKTAPTALSLADDATVVVHVLGEGGRIYEAHCPSKLLELDEPTSLNAAWSAWSPVTGPEELSGAGSLVRLAPKKSQAYYRQLLFGSTNSVGDYYLEASYGKFTFKEAAITPWINFILPPGLNRNQISAEYVRFVENRTSIDFATYDSNGDGKVTNDELAVLVFYPGFQSAVAADTDPKLVPVPSLSHGVEIRMARGGAGMSRFTVAHELGHVLGHTDLYSDDNEGHVGSFSLMTTGNDITHLDPWAKMKLGWLKPVAVQNDGCGLLRDVEKNPEAYVLYSTKGTQEYFILENRWPGTSYEKNLGDRGLAIWRVIENPGTGLSRETLHIVSPTAGKYELWDGSESATQNTLPVSLKWGDGSLSGITITGISAAGSTMQVCIDVPN